MIILTASCLLGWASLSVEKQKLAELEALQQQDVMEGWKLIGQKNGCQLYHQTYRNNQSVFWSICENGTSSVSAIQPY